MYELHHGDCLEVLKSLPDCIVDAVVTDPPYGLSFMGKRWDYDVPSVEVWAECLRVLKPGGHLLAFAGTRTQHRMAVRIEDAGFELRDMIAWVYGSGFPKSLDVSKALDKMRHGGRDEVLRVTGWIRERCRSLGLNGSHLNAAAGVVGMASHWMTDKQQPLIPTLEQWQKIEPVLGPAPEWMVPLLRPAFEHGEAWQNAEVIGVQEGAMSGWSMDGDTKFVDREIKAPATNAARQWQGWGTALKPALEPITVARKPLIGAVAENVLAFGTGAINVDGCRVEGRERSQGCTYGAPSESVDFDSSKGRWPANLIHDGSEEVAEVFGDPARFFYCAKASKKDRGDGNNHPTVKPTDLMRYLCRLVTPPGGVVLDPFTGSGSTGKAAMLEGFRFIGIEREAEYVEIAKARVAAGLRRLAEELAG